MSEGLSKVNHNRRRQKILEAEGRRRFWKDGRQGDET